MYPSTGQPLENLLLRTFPPAEENATLDSLAFIDASLPHAPSLTRRQLRSLSSSLAWSLKHTILVPESSNPSVSSALHPNDNIMVLAEGSLAWPIFLFGGIAAGLRYHFVPAAANLSEIACHWFDSQARAVFVSLRYLDIIQQTFDYLGMSKEESERRIWVVDALWDPLEASAMPELSRYHSCSLSLKIQASPTTPELDGHCSEAPLYVCYGSGIAASVRGAQISHRNINAMINALSGALMDSGAERDVYMSVGAPQSISSLISAVHYPACSRIPVVLLDSNSEPRTFLDVIRKYKVTTLSTTSPSLLTALLRASKTDLAHTSLRKIFFWGSPLAPARMSDLMFKLSSRIADLGVLQSLGLPECPVISSFLPAQDVIQNPGKLGEMIPNLEAMLVANDSPTYRPQPPESSSRADGVNALQGELWIRGPAVARGYLNDPSSTSQNMTPDGFFKTGHVVRFDEVGNLHHLGTTSGYSNYRSATQCVVPAAASSSPHPWHDSIAGGLHPEDIELALLQHPDVLDASVVQVPDLYHPNNTLARFVRVWRRIHDHVLLTHLTRLARVAAELGHTDRAYVVPRDQSILQDYGQRARFENSLRSWADRSLTEQERLRGGIFVTHDIPRGDTGHRSRVGMTLRHKAEPEELRQMDLSRL